MSVDRKDSFASVVSDFSSPVNNSSRRLRRNLHHQDRLPHHRLVQRYEVPEFCRELEPDEAMKASWPTHRCRLIPPYATPVEPLFFSGLPEDFPLLVKRDDFCGGLECGGNKTRKLEFHLSQILKGSYDTVVTIGGTQSNHVRQTAAACAKVGIDCFAILRVDSPHRNGNLLLTELFGAVVEFVTREEVKSVGYKSLKAYDALLERRKDALEAEGRKVFVIPIGGMDEIGWWAYVEWVHELVEQIEHSGPGDLSYCTAMENPNFPTPPPQSFCSGDEVVSGSTTSTPASAAAPRLSLESEIDTIVSACGTGGTVGGIAFGVHRYLQHKQRHGLLSPRAQSLFSSGQKNDCVKVLGIGISDYTDFFYKEVDQILPQVCTDGLKARDLLTIKDYKGLGYAKFTQEELQFLSMVARETGLLLDPCYTGKTMLGLYREIRDGTLPRPKDNRKILFLHTGGLPAVFAHADALAPLSHYTELPESSGASMVGDAEVFGKY